MNAWGFAFGTLIVLASSAVALVLGTQIVTAVRDVKVSRFTGIDPRLDDDLRADALRQLREENKRS